MQAADLVKQLKGAGPYTVFAPTDDAFAKIPKADLDALLKDKVKLHKVLTHHVFAGNANSTDLAMLKDLSVADGGRLFIAIYNDQGKTSRRWTTVKKAYCALPGPLQFLVLWPAFVFLWWRRIVKEAGIKPET